MFAFATPRTSRRPALTPLIDVVFLLLVFFMLASKFGQDGSLNLSGGGDGGTYEGPPRLLTILPDGVLLNGQPVAQTALIDVLENLSETEHDAIILTTRDGADVQHLTKVVQFLSDAGFAHLILVE